jgi:hypothetical protein
MGLYGVDGVTMGSPPPPPPYAPMGYSGRRKHPPLSPHGSRRSTRKSSAPRSTPTDPAGRPLTRCRHGQGGPGDTVRGRVCDTPGGMGGGRQPPAPGGPPGGVRAGRRKVRDPPHKIFSRNALSSPRANFYFFPATTKFPSSRNPRSRRIPLGAIISVCSETSPSAPES